MKVLIAEDDPVSRRLLEATLARWGYEVVAAADGTEAWRVLGGADAPPLAILDWMMPGMDGVEVCRRVRARTTPTPRYLILLTAKGQRDDVVAGLEAGADDYVTKPFDRAELCARVAVGVRIVELQQALADRVRALEEALAQVKHLRGMLPICAYCKKIRADQDYWQQVETYVAAHSEMQFSHGICPTCYEAVVKPQLDQLRRARGAVTADPPAAP
jgi:sigma-B regulation protein RsbU (phosphoserine phosphatase)